jgi:hypothetical protein
MFCTVRAYVRRAKKFGRQAYRVPSRERRQPRENLRIVLNKTTKVLDIVTDFFRKQQSHVEGVKHGEYGERDDLRKYPFSKAGAIDSYELKPAAQPTPTPAAAVPLQSIPAKVCNCELACICQTRITRIHATKAIYPCIACLIYATMQTCILSVCIDACAHARADTHVSCRSMQTLCSLTR